MNIAVFRPVEFEPVINDRHFINLGVDAKENEVLVFIPKKASLQHNKILKANDRYYIRRFYWKNVIFVEFEILFWINTRSLN